MLLARIHEGGILYGSISETTTAPETRQEEAEELIMLPQEVIFGWQE